MTDEDEAFGEIEKAQQRKVANGVTDGPAMRSFTATLGATSNHRNEVLEEVAKEFDRMKALGDTSASFACFVRGMTT